MNANAPDLRIPTIAADLITAAAVIGEITRYNTLYKARLVQAIADSGMQVDDITVGDLRLLATNINRQPLQTMVPRR